MLKGVWGLIRGTEVGAGGMRLGHTWMLMQLLLFFLRSNFLSLRGLSAEQGWSARDETRWVKVTGPALPQVVRAVGMSLV